MSSYFKISEAHPASCTVGTRSFLGVKQRGCDVDHPSPSSAEVKERVELYHYSPSGPSWPVLGELYHYFTLPLYFKIFSASFCITFLSPGIATSINIHVFVSCYHGL